MNNPLHAAYYADLAGQYVAHVLDNRQLARDTYRIRIECPEVAQRILPGQFLMLRLPDCDDPLLGRPLALYDTVLDESGNPIAVDIVYLVIGKATGKMTELVKHDQITLWGPLGNGFQPQSTEHLVMVAGGIGQTPFLALGREQLGGRKYGAPPRDVAVAPRVTLCYGARTADYLAGVEDFRAADVDVRISTDDGSHGHHGLVTDLLEQILTTDESTPHVVCCGPEPMMEAVAGITSERNVPCQVSLETPMACGIGICFSCVAKVRDESGQWDYKRTCVEGPVFDARKIEW